jgi:phage head maturation protease
MGWFGRAVDWVRGVPSSGQFTSDLPPARPIAVLLAEMAQASGRVSRAQALTVPAVLRGRNLICGEIAGLQLEQLTVGYRRVASRLLEQIDPEVANVVTLAQTIEDLLFEGRSWWRILARDVLGFPTACEHLDFSSVSLKPPAGRLPAPLPGGVDPHGAVIYVGGDTVPARDVLRFDSPNPGFLISAGPAVRRCILLDKAAENYANDPRAQEYFTPRDGVDPADDAVVEGMLNKWVDARRRRAAAYVPAALEYNSVDVMNPAELQLVQLQQRASLEIANSLGIDPEDLGISTTSRTYQNAIDRRRDRINSTLQPYMLAVANRLSMPDVTPVGDKVRFDLDEYLRADPMTRVAYYTGMHALEALTGDEIRAEEYLPELTPTQRLELEQARAAAQPAPAGPQDQQTRSAGLRAAADVVPSVAAFDAAGASFTMALQLATFAVDVPNRMISGVAVPYGRVAVHKGRRYRFMPGSLEWDDPRRVKLNMEHDHSQWVGRGESFSDGPAGLDVSFKVGAGADGDRALLRADDGIYDGLSVEVDFIDLDPNGRDEYGSVIDVYRAKLKHVALTPDPAFTDARISMAASNDQGETPMQPCPRCGHMHPPTVTCMTPPAPAQPAQPAQPADVAAAFSAWLAAGSPGAAQPAPAPAGAPAPAQPAQPAPPVQPAPAGPPDAAAFSAWLASAQAQPVNPVPRDQRGPQVAEAPLYRFDGRKAQRSLVGDIASGAFNSDPELRGRAEKFIADAMEAAFANISVSNMTDLNPTINRPDLYVGSLHFTRTLGSMATGGVVDEITTQRLPKFNTSSGLTATHVQGTEPTDGAVTATHQDITPAAISGRVTVNREVIDQGGTPQADQIIWNEMTQFYAELLEQRLVDALQALSLSDTPIVGVDGDLQTALLTTFAGLQFIKGGDRYRAMGLHQDLYTAALNATDGDGRPLFPMLNAVNADGSSAADFSAIRIGNKVGVPAWALASANGGPDKSFLFVPSSVYQWFSPPRRIDLAFVAVATVGIGIWGYSAEFVTRNADVLQFAYTAA